MLKKDPKDGVKTANTIPVTGECTLANWKIK